MEEQGVQLVALVLHLAQGVLELAGHVVKGVGQHADLVLGGHLNLFGKIPLGHPHGPLGEALNGGDHGFGQQEGQQNGDHQAEDQRLDDEHQHLVGEVVGGGLVVQNVDHIARPAPVDGDGHVHVIQGQIAVVPHLAGLQAGGQGEGEIFRVLQLGRLPVGGDQGHPVAVQNVQLPVAVVHPQLAGEGVHHLEQLLRPVLLLVGGGGQVVVEQGVLKDVGHLAVEVLQIEGGHRVDEEGPHHHHQGQNQQNHNHDQLHVQAAQHGDSLLSLLFVRHKPPFERRCPSSQTGAEDCISPQAKCMK